MSPRDAADLFYQLFDVKVEHMSGMVRLGYVAAVRVTDTAGILVAGTLTACFDNCHS